jgi:ribulose-5-phosphate 4-epimerase/fuculose-1-phosphate aldolase
MALARLAAKGLPQVHLSVRDSVGSVEDRYRALHVAIYRLRPDVGAIITGHFPWACRLAALGGGMPAMFDEQVRHLGPRVDDLYLDRGELTSSSAKRLRRGGNAFLLGADAVCFGFDIHRAVLNAELFEKSVQAYVLARLSGVPIRTIPFYVRYIAAKRLRDERHGAASDSRHTPCETNPNPTTRH